MTSEQITTAEDAGRAAGAAGRPLADNPYSHAQGSSTRVLAIAWRRGWVHADRPAA